MYFLVIGFPTSIWKRISYISSHINHSTCQKTVHNICGGQNFPPPLCTHARWSYPSSRPEKDVKIIIRKKRMNTWLYTQLICDEGMYFGIVDSVECHRIGSWRLRARQASMENTNQGFLPGSNGGWNKFSSYNLVYVLKIATREACHIAVLKDICWILLL